MGKRGVGDDQLESITKMRIIKAPLRISLFGGGTDLPEYREQHGSTIISFAINRHIYLVHNPRPTGGYRLAYSKVEELSTLTDAKHTIIRQAALIYGNLEPCTISIISDVPKGTGLGSSSSLAVATCLLFKNSESIKYAHNVARVAYSLEHSISNCGIQDHLPPSFGGFNVYKIGPDGSIARTAMPRKMITMVETYGLLLYTGWDRQADPVLKWWRKNPAGLVDRIHALADAVCDELDTITPERLGDLLDNTWKLKSSIGGVSDSGIDDAYKRAIGAGALGGKLLGAGNGGCFFFIVHPKMRQAVIDELRMKEIPFFVSRIGARTSYA